MPDVIVLDVMLPGFDGIEVCRRIRRFSDACVLMLSARSEEADKILGLSVGADDYLAKPFSPRELVARVRALLRRLRRADGQLEPEHEPRPRQFDGLVIDEGRHEVHHEGEAVELTAREFILLTTLATFPGRVFTRAQLVERAWGYEDDDGRLVDVHIGNLRRKLDDDPRQPRYVETVRGVGYRFVAASARPEACSLRP